MPEQENKLHKTIVLGSRREGPHFSVDIIDLMQPLIGGEVQNVKTIRSLLEARAAAAGSDFKPITPDALDVIAEAYPYFDMRFDEGGWRVTRQFTGRAVLFKNGWPHSIAREYVDPAETEQFQRDNPDWVRETPADENP